MTKVITRRTAFALAGAALAAPSIGRADTALPDKTLKILVGFPAGGGSDVMARFIAEALEAAHRAQRHHRQQEPAPRAPWRAKR